MDKRIIKTKSNIKTSFMKLAKQKGKDGIFRVHVNELCEDALINKSTFYRHYEDIPQLIDEIRKELSNDIFQNIPSKGKLFENPEQFLTDIRLAISERESDLLTLYPDEMIWPLLEQLNCKLTEYYQIPANSLEDKIKISFLLGGASYATMQHRMESPEKMSQIIAKLIKNCDI